MIFSQYLHGRACALLNSVQKFIECLKNSNSNTNSMSEKRDSSNRQQKRIVASFSNFYGKTWVGFCLNI